MEDGGRKTPCCREADAQDLREQPELFDCTSCGVARVDALWPENAEAWRCYRTLCGRTVRTFELHEWALSSFTEGWTPEARDDLLVRLDLIVSLVSPEPSTHGSDTP